MYGSKKIKEFRAYVKQRQKFIKGRRRLEKFAPSFLELFLELSLCGHLIGHLFQISQKNLPQIEPNKIGTIKARQINQNPRDKKNLSGRYNLLRQTERGGEREKT